MSNNASWTIEQLLEHADWIRRLAHMLVRDPVAADDLAQDTWVQALRSPPKQQGPLKPWLATILRNLVRERFRKTERRERRELAAEGPLELAPAEDLAQRAEAQKLVVEFVLELPAHYRDVVLLSYFEGLSGPEIAERMGIPEVTVRSRLKRGLDQLRERFDRKYGERKAWVVMLMPLARRPNGGAGASSASTVTLSKVLLGVVVALVLVPVTLWLVHDRNPDGPSEPARAAALAEVDSAPATEPERSLALIESPTPTAERPIPLAVYEATLVTAEGVAVAGASVEFRRDVLPKNSAIFTQVRPHPTRLLGSTTSDAAGRFRFETPQGESFDVLISTPQGMAIQRLERVAGEAMERIEIPAAAAVFGRITRIEDGTPIDDAVVALVRDFQGDPVAETRTDANGAYRIEGLASGSTKIVVTAPSLRLRQERLELIAGRAVQRDIAIKRRGTFEGVLYDRDTKAPVANAEVGWMVGHRTVRTDEQGAFRIEGLDYGPLDFMWTRAEGFGFCVLYGRPRKGEADVVRGRVGLTPAYSVRGRLTDELGTPLNAVRVLVVAAQIAPESPTTDLMLGQRRGDQHETMTGPDGSFVVTDMRSDGVHELVVIAPDLACTPIALPTAPSPRADVDVGVVVVPSARTIVGTLLDAAGRPLAGERVVCVSESKFAKQLIEKDLVWRDYDEVREPATRTDAVGQFCLRWVDAGPVRVRVLDAADRVVAQELVVIPPTASIHRMELRCATGREITGFVRDPTGNPVPNAQVYVSDANDPNDEGFTLPAEADGSFALRNLPTDKWMIRATAPLASRLSTNFGNSEWMDVNAGSHDVVVTLPLFHWVEVHVLSKDDQPLSMVRVEFKLKSGNERVYWADTAVTGMVNVLVPLDSEFEIRVLANGDESSRRVVEPAFRSGGVADRTPLEIRL